MEESRYKCPRCHYKTDSKSHFVKHLHIKTPCPSLHSNTSAVDILSSLNQEKAFKCPHCDKSFVHASNLSRHKKDHANDPVHLISEPEQDPELIDDSPAKSTEGLVYLATSPLVNGFKLGYWRAKPKTLYDRYKTYYGNDLEFYLFPCQDCLLLEDIAKVLFKPHNLSFELHSQDKLKHYVEVLSHLCVLPETELRKIMIQCGNCPQSFFKALPQSTTHETVFTHIVPFKT